MKHSVACGQIRRQVLEHSLSQSKFPIIPPSLLSIVLTERMVMSRLAQFLLNQNFTVSCDTLDSFLENLSSDRHVTHVFNVMTPYLGWD